MWKFLFGKSQILPAIATMGTVFLMVAGCRTPSSVPSELSEQKFATPPVEVRPMALWDWINSYVDSTKLVYELEEMKAKGMQGALIWDLGSLADPKKMIPAGPEFLGKESMEHISLVLKHSARLGLNMGLMTASSWNAGGSWIPQEEASMELRKNVQVISGPGKRTIAIGKPEKSKTDYYRHVATVAVPHTGNKTIYYASSRAINLESFVKDAENIVWDVPAGKWDVISFFMCATGQHLVCPSPNSDGWIIDHLSRKATRRHFDTIISRLASVSGPENRIKYLDLDSYEVWPAIDWSPELIREFKNRLGYDPVPYMPLLEGYSADDKVLAERFRGDYGRMVSDMMIENHFEQGTALANAAGMQLIAEAGHGGYPRVDPLKAMGHTDIPMGEFWNGRQFWVTKEAASAAHIYGRKLIASESLTGWHNWEDGPSDYKMLFDIAFCEGLNQGVFHTFAHNPSIAGKPGFVYHAGEHLNVNTTWWEMSKPFMDYISRCSYLLRMGEFVGDFCMYYGDQAPNLVPPKRIDPDMEPPHEKNECQHCGKPKPVDPGEIYGYDYDYMNAEIISHVLKVEDGNLVLPSGISYRFMLLPDREDISLDVLKSLERLIYDGAVIIGPRPVRTTSLQNYPECDREVKEIADRIWGRCNGKDIVSNTYGKGKVYWGITVNELLKEMDIAPDFEVRGTDNHDMHIDYIHRRSGEEEIYFVSNSSRSPQQINCTFRVDKDLVPEIWDAESGLIQRKVTYKVTDNGISMDMVMDPIASRFVIFRPATTGMDDPGLDYDLQFGLSKKTLVEKKRTDLSEDWNISFDTAWGGPAAYKAAVLESWSDNKQEDIRYFSGKAVYTKDFNIEEDELDKMREAHLVFTDIQKTARVSVNGKDCGILWTPPYRVGVGKYLESGNNTLEVEVINTWNNRLVGEATHPDIRQYTHTNIKHKFRNKPLLKSGITGKVELIFY